MMGLHVDGPYYRCAAPKGTCKWFSIPGRRAPYHEPKLLRWIKGNWRCQSCFEEGFGADVHHEWDTATTLAEYLEAHDAE